MPTTCIIDRLHLSVVASAAPARADALLARLREVAARKLGEAIAAGLPDVADESVVFIDRLDFDCALNAAWDDEQLARACARDFVHALTAQADAAGVRRFADRAEFVASFAIALADGDAERCWWFDEFEGLRLLPRSSALRTVLGGEGAAAWAALARLTDAAAQRVLQTLTPADARRLMSALGRADGGLAPPLAGLRRALAAPLAERVPGAAHRVLAALVALAREEPASIGARAVDALQALAALHTAAASGALATHLTADASPRVALARCCAATGIAPDALAAWSEADVDELLDTLRRAAPSPPDVATADAERSAWGGTWLLVALLARLGWWQRWQDAGRDASGEHAGDLAHSLVLAVAARALLGDAHALLTEDPLLRRIFGDPHPAPAAGWLRHVLRLPLAPPRASAFATTPLGAGRRRRVALIEADRGSIVGLFRPAQAAAAVAAALPADAVLVSTGEPSSEAPDDLAAAIAWWQAHGPAASHGALDDLDDLDDLLAIVALNLLREFASRLPGCRESSPAYLRSQCLSMSAHVTLDDACIGVRLGRAPLDVLLTLAGINRGTTVLPDGRALRIETDR